MSGDCRGRSVGIFKVTFPVPSETFISSQARALSTYRPLIITRRQLDSSDLPVVAASHGDRFGLRQGWLAVTRSMSSLLADERVRRISLVHGHFGLDSVYALSLAERLSLPLVSSFHGLDTTARRWPLFIAQFGMTVINYVLFFNRLRRRGALFIAASDFLAECLRRQGYPPERIVRLYIGVDTERFSPASPAERAGRARYLLNVARHIPVKGIPVLLRAFAEISGRHPSVALLQVGAGPQTPMLQRLARELGLADRDRFLGEQPPEQVRLLLGDDTLRQRMGCAGREHVCRHFCLRTQTAQLERLYDRVIDRWHGSES